MYDFSEIEKFHVGSATLLPCLKGYGLKNEFLRFLIFHSKFCLKSDMFSDLVNLALPLSLRHPSQNNFQNYISDIRRLIEGALI